ncbi:beta strand repeat-containing protein [Caldisphaera sp.]|uniref:beta strand repeat-containing protein n=1 Tax=Caldisphaera sp. TaxID=2060322 RepID=UPI003D0F659A
MKRKIFRSHIKLNVIIPIFIVLLALLLLFPIRISKASSNQIIYVPQQYSSLQDAINAATPGTTIYVSQGYLYNGSILIQNKQDLTIIGQGNVVLNYGGYGNTTIIDSSYITIENLNISGGLDIISSSQISLKNVNVSGIISLPNQVLGDDLLVYDVNSLYMQNVIAYWTMPGMTYTTYQGINITDSSNLTLNNVMSYALNGYGVYIDNSNGLTMQNDLFNSPSNGGIGIGLVNLTKAVLTDVNSNQSYQLYVLNVSSLSINGMDYSSSYQTGGANITNANQLTINDANFNGLSISQIFKTTLNNVLDLGSLSINGVGSLASAILNNVSVYQYVDISNLSSISLNNIKVYNTNFQTSTTYGLYLTNFLNSQITDSNIWGGLNITNGNYLNITNSLIPSNNTYEYYSDYVLFNNINTIALSNASLGGDGVLVSNGNSLSLYNLKAIYLSGISINNYNIVKFNGVNISTSSFSLSNFSSLNMINSYLSSNEGMNITGTTGSSILLNNFNLEADKFNPYANGIMVYNVYNFTATNSVFSSHDGEGGIGIYTDGIPYVYLNNVKSVGWFGHYGGTGIWLVNPIDATIENTNVTGIDTQTSFSYAMLGQTGIMITGSSKLILTNLIVSSFNNAINITGNSNGVTLSKVSTKSFNVGIFVGNANTLSLNSINVYISSESPSYGIYLNNINQVNVNQVNLIGKSNQIEYTNFEINNGKSLTISYLNSNTSGTGPYIGLNVFNYSTLALSNSNVYDGIYLTDVPYITMNNINAGLSTYYGIAIYALSVLNGKFNYVNVLRNDIISSTGMELTGISGKSVFSLNQINSQSDISIDKAYNVSVANTKTDGLFISNSYVSNVYLADSSGGISFNAVNLVYLTQSSSDGISVSYAKNASLNNLNSIATNQNSNSNGISFYNVTYANLNNANSLGWNGSSGVYASYVAFLNLNNVVSGGGTGIDVSYTNNINIKNDNVKYGGINILGYPSSTVTIENVFTNGGIRIFNSYTSTLTNINDVGKIEADNTIYLTMSSINIVSKGQGISISNSNSSKLFNITSLSQGGISITGNKNSIISINDVTSKGNMPYNTYGLSVNNGESLSLNNFFSSEGISISSINYIKIENVISNVNNGNQADVYVNNNNNLNVYNLTESIYNGTFQGMSTTGLNIINLNQGNDNLLDVKINAYYSNPNVSANGISISNGNSISIENSYINLPLVNASSSGYDIYIASSRSSSLSNLVLNGANSISIHNSNTTINEVSLTYSYSGINLGNSKSATIYLVKSVANGNTSGGSIFANNVSSLKIYETLSIGGLYGIVTVNDNPLIYNNTVENSVDGIMSEYSKNTTIFENYVENTTSGINSVYSTNVTIFSNEIIGNKYGIGLIGVNHAYVYLNYFNNSKNIYVSNSNVTYNTESKVKYTFNGNSFTNYLGNYWYGYKGSEIDSEGIGSKPYNTTFGLDNYPLTSNPSSYQVTGISTTQVTTPTITVTTSITNTTTTSPTQTTTPISTSSTSTQTSNTSSSKTLTSKAPSFTGSLTVGVVIAIVIIAGAGFMILKRKK